ncbi:hypothetical protein NBH00_03425 [Paraconexibacter antarcticus]|uniref:Uncharacterized protein n=1 Tax=Paraconexibacter antarcticus TaxID=2949664 RepID=A0ABY5DUL7_9ACTN|nr:hypothetical protein [Paraconexibacter antarcticus]UTI65269.1 hypothetical protein NBH00_03425 [Paraconexibacter antarcticus]
MSKHDQQPDEPRRGLRGRFGTGSVRTRNVIAATGILAIGVTATGFAATGSPLLQGKRNGTTSAETEIIANINSTNGPTGGYSTRQSNLSSTGGGAVYGCRSTAGGSAAIPPTNPCLRANNLSTGYAFEFNASNGLTAGLITVGKGGDATKPFTTNATGVATGLNADRVDGKNATDFLGATEKATDSAKLGGQEPAAFAQAGDFLFAAVDATGKVTASRGGTATAAVTPATTTATVTFTKDVSKCSFTATPNTATATSGLSLAVSSVTADGKQVRVDEAGTPTPAVLVPFHLQVIC